MSEKIWVYNKKNPISRLFNILFILGISLVLISSLIQVKWIFYILILIMIVFGITRMISVFWTFSPFKYASQLKLNADSINFLNNELKLSLISKVTIRLRDKEIKPLRSENSFIQIRTYEGEVFELAVLIDNSSDLETVQNLVSELKKRVGTVVFENYIE